MKNKFIKVMSLTLALIMCLGVLCSCSTNSKAYAKSEGGNKISLAMYSLVTSLMKGNDAYYIVQKYGSYNSPTYWGTVVDSETQMTMKEYYEYLIELKIKNYLAALDLFDELGLSLTDEEIAAIDAEMAEFVDIDGDGSKKELNKLLANYGANYKTLREYKIMNAKINKLSAHLYGTGGSKVSDEIKQQYLKDNYVAFKMIMLPTFDYKYNEDKFGNSIYYEKGSDGKIVTEKSEIDGKTYSKIAYDSVKGFEFDLDSDGKIDIDNLGYKVYYTYDNMSIAYDKENGKTLDVDGDGKKDTDIFGSLVYYANEEGTAIAYDKEKGTPLEGVEGSTDKFGSLAYFDFDFIIAYNKDASKTERIFVTDKQGNKVTEDFSATEKLEIEAEANDIMDLVKEQNYDLFEELITVYDKNYSIESEEDRGGMIYISSDESYSAGAELMNDMYEKISEIDIGGKLLYKSDSGYHIIMRYEPEAGAYSNAKYEFYFKSFVTNLVNELFFDRIEPYTANITINEKFKKEVDISTITPNYNFY